MLLNQFHWLDIAEYVSIGITLISLLTAIASGSVLYPIIFLAIALVLNLINRLRFQQRSRKRLSGLVKQIQRQLTEEMEALTEKELIPTTSTTMQQKLLSLEESLNGIIQHLNTYRLAERIEHLEQAFVQLRKENSHLVHQSKDSIPTQPKLPPTGVAPITSVPVAPTWTCIHTLNEHTEAITSLAISPDGRFLASASWDQTLKLWEIESGKLIDTAIGHSQGLLAVVFTQEANQSSYWDLVTGGFDQTIRLWSIEPRQEHLLMILTHTLTAHTGSIHALAIAAKHQILLSGSYDQTLKQWDLENGKMLRSSFDSLGAIYAIALDPEEKVIASAGGDGRITLWQLESGERIDILSGNISSVESLAISPDGKMLAAGCVDGSLKLWHLEAGKTQPSLILSAHGGQVKALLFSRDSQNLYSSGADGKIKIWHPSSKSAIAVLNFNDEVNQRLCPLFSLAFSSNNSLLAAGSGDGTIKIWQRD